MAMPAMSPTMTEGGIASWKKNEGESFAAGDVLLEVASCFLSFFDCSFVFCGKMGMGADGKGVFGFGFVGDGQGDDRCGSAGRWCDGQDRRKSTIYLSRKRMTYGLKHFLGKNSYRCKLARRKSQLVRLLLFLLKKGTICRPSLSLKPLPPPLPSSPNNSPRRSPESKRRQSRKRGNSQGMREGTMNTRRSNIPNHCSLVSRDCAWPYLHRAHGALTSVLLDCKNHPCRRTKSRN